jgi:hypothetical protein
MRYPCLILLSYLFLVSCAPNRRAYNPEKKYSRTELVSDYRLLRQILEAKHPSLDWYLPRDSVQYYFDYYERAISDSMTEPQFAWKILSPLTHRFRCGHTSVLMSKAYGKWAKANPQPSFPLFMKIWNDSMAVTVNLNKKDSVLKWGTLITSINGIRNRELLAHLFAYLSVDGYAENVSYIRLSGNFPFFHRNIYGLSPKYQVTYLDSLGNERATEISAWYPPKKDSTQKDSTRKPTVVKAPPAPPKLTKQQKLESIRKLTIDSSGTYALMTVNGFSGGRLRRFFRQSFRTLKEKKIDQLIIDIRSNGGGKVNLSTLLTRYITRKPFRVADSAYATHRSLAPYTRYIYKGFWNNLGLIGLARKKKNGVYHVSYLERTTYKPKKQAYNGNVYLLTGGLSFSAAALFAHSVKGQPGITLVGEETGGGDYGNNGILIPEIILPQTRLRVRLPLFRLIQYQHGLNQGRGVMPDIWLPPDYQALLQKRDKKMDWVIRWIQEHAKKR